MDSVKEFSKKMYSKAKIEEYDKKIKLLGTGNNIDTITFLNTRLISSIVLFIILLFIAPFSYIVAPLGTIAYYYFIKIITLDNKIKERRIRLEKEAVEFFEVLTLSLETGRNLEEAIKITTLNINSELSLEFREVLRELKFGKSLTEALDDMQENIPSESINNIILVLTQADLFGNSVIKNLRIQIDYLQEKRKMEIKGEISKIPIRISVISVIFFIPLLLLIILAPIILGYLI